LHGVYNTDHSTPIQSGNPAKIASFTVELGDHFLNLTRGPGSGPDVLLIHGISSSGLSWQPILSGLGKSFFPITIDLRGHGQSGRPATGYLYDDYAGDVEAAINALGMERPLIIGHSLGGLIALWWARTFPNKAAAIVIEDSPLRSGEDYRLAFDNWITQNAMPVVELAALYRAKNPGLSEEHAWRRAEIMTRTAPAVFTELKADSLAHDGVDRVAGFERIAAPILFLHGNPERGGMVPAAEAEAFAQRLPNVTVVGFPDVGHSLHAERPDAFVEAVVPFLKAHAGG
jgi:pimeloyl-ACP methyl ester carboxylesterase